MVARQRPEWTAVEIASHVLKATSLSQLTLPEVKKLAARVLRDQGDSTEPNAAEPVRIVGEAAKRLDASDRR